MACEKEVRGKESFNSIGNDCVDARARCIFVGRNVADIWRGARPLLSFRRTKAGRARGCSDSFPSDFGRGVHRVFFFFSFEMCRWNWI